MTDSPLGVYAQGLMTDRYVIQAQTCEGYETTIPLAVDDDATAFAAFDDWVTFLSRDFEIVRLLAYDSTLSWPPPFGSLSMSARVVLREVLR